MVGATLQERSGVSAVDALQQALAALQEGRHDSRIAEGAQANALESIAWSLIGLLGDKTDSAAAARPMPSQEKRTVSDELRANNLWQIGTQR